MNKGIDVEIIKDSTSWTGKRLTTFVLKYPRYIHSELMTHRVFSKNSASSRAIPILKMVDNIKEDMVQPIWTKNQSGMQGIDLEDEFKKIANHNWEIAFDNSLRTVRSLISYNVHKQNVNRLLEPWMHIKIILTGTDFDNWYELRNHPDAQPEIQELAKKMLKIQSESVPQYLQPGEWHIPFDDKYTDEELATYAFSNALQGFGADREWVEAILNLRVKISLANCARISYNNVDGTKTTIGGDLELYKKLLESKPLHASPAEHQAGVPFPSDFIEGHFDVKHLPGFVVGDNDDFEEVRKKFLNGAVEGGSLQIVKGKYVSNLQGWKQYRKVLEEQFKNK